MGRRKLWIDREIQLRFVIYTVIFLVITSAVISIATFYSVWVRLSGSITLTDLKNLPMVYSETFSAFAGRVILLTAILAIIACLGIILLSHRIAGPVYRMTNILKDLQQGKEPQLILRKGDSLVSLMDELKSFVVLHTKLSKASRRVLDMWGKTQVQDLSLNLALQDLEECLEGVPQSAEGAKPQEVPDEKNEK